MNLESKARINSLISAANATTGKADTDLTSAVGALIAGFGQGGGNPGGGASGIYMAKITPANDTQELNVTHNLGTTDILLAVCFAETLGDITPTFNGALAKFWAKSDIPRRVTSSWNEPCYDHHYSYITSNGNMSGGMPASDAYFCRVKDENNFIFDSAGAAAAKYITGVTYTVIIMSASAFRETEG